MRVLALIGGMLRAKRTDSRSRVSRMSAALLPLLLMHAAPTVAHARQASAGGDAGEQVRRSLEAAAPAIDFTTAQLRHSRVLQARLQMRFGIKRLFRERGIPYPAEQIFIRVFKRERTLE